MCKVKLLGNLYGFTGGNFSGNVYSPKGLSPTINTMGGGNREPMIVVKEVRSIDGGGQAPIMAEKNDNHNILFTIFDLCSIINEKEKEKYESSRTLLSILWEEIGKKEVWETIRRSFYFPEEEILQQKMYEYGLPKDRQSQSNISSSASNSSKYNEIIEHRKEVFNMWENWKIRYTPQRWELSEQQYKQFNILMQKLSYEKASTETSLQDLRCADERIGVLQQTLYKIQEIWRSSIHKKQDERIEYRIRKLSPLECWRLMGFNDEDYATAKVGDREKAKKLLEEYPQSLDFYNETEKVSAMSQTQMYKQAGNSIVKNVLMAIFTQIINGDSDE